MICKKCKMEFTGDQCPNCNEATQFEKKVAASFVEENEKLLNILGTNTAKTFFSTGILGNGFAILSNKRMYFKGKCYVRVGKGFFKKVEERIVDLGDITGTGFVHNKNMVFSILFYILTAIYSLSSLLPIPFWFVYFSTGKKWAFNTAFILSGPISWLFYFLDKMFNYSLFEISYAGGGIGFDLHWISNTDAQAFQKALQQAKTEYKRKFQEQYVENIPNTQTSKSTPEEIKAYKELLDNGIISQEEFEIKKKQLLGL